MRPESLVFDRDDRVDQVRRDLRERNADAMFLEQSGHHAVVGIVEQRRFRTGVETEAAGKRFHFDSQRPQSLHRQAGCD